MLTHSPKFSPAKIFRYTVSNFNVLISAYAVLCFVFTLCCTVLLPYVGTYDNNNNNYIDTCSRSVPNMLEILLIIPSHTSQKYYRLFSYHYRLFL